MFTNCNNIIVKSFTEINQMQCIYIGNRDYDQSQSIKNKDKISEQNRQFWVNILKIRKKIIQIISNANITPQIDKY